MKQRKEEGITEEMKPRKNNSKKKDVQCEERTAVRNKERIKGRIKMNDIKNE